MGKKGRDYRMSYAVSQDNESVGRANLITREWWVELKLHQKFIITLMYLMYVCLHILYMYILLFDNMNFVSFQLVQIKSSDPKSQFIKTIQYHLEIKIYIGVWKEYTFKIVKSGRLKDVDADFLDQHAEVVANIWLKCKLESFRAPLLRDVCRFLVVLCGMILMYNSVTIWFSRLFWIWCTEIALVFLSIVNSLYSSITENYQNCAKKTTTKFVQGRKFNVTSIDNDTSIFIFKFVDFAIFPLFTLCAIVIMVIDNKKV